MSGDNRRFFRLCICAASLACVIAAADCIAQEQGTSALLEPWRPGYLDVHHISVAADATLMVYPDGTTLLFDAGDSDKAGFERRAWPLKAATVRPNASKRPGEWYADYIEAVLKAAGLPARLDYAGISHFHTDHYGLWRENAPTSVNGDYRLTGMTDVAERVPIGTLIDRGYPDYNYPLDLTRYARDSDPTLMNYLEFIASRTEAGKDVQAPLVGATDQLGMRRKPDSWPGFSVRIVKANGTIWNPASRASRQTILEAEDVLGEDGSFNENPLSLALLVTYGAFDYFTGGDMTGEDDPARGRLDTETPLAAVLGEVDALALNHHGVRDATNASFTRSLHPQIAVVHGRTSDHPGQEVVVRLGRIRQPHRFPVVFGTFIHEETKIAYGPDMHRILAPEQGHIVLRVYPPGDRFDVFVLDDRYVNRFSILAKYGPYVSRD